MNRQNYEMVSGDTKLLIVTVTDDNGEVVDVSGASVTYVIADRETRVTKTTDSGITIGPDPDTPEQVAVLVTLAPADTEALAGLYGHEMQVTDTQGNVSTVLGGQVGIARDIIV